MTSHLKINLSSEKGGELFFIGMSTATGIAVLSSQINRYLDIELTFYKKLMAVQNDSVYDQLPIFTNFEPEENELNLEAEPDIFDFKLPDRKEVTKYLLMQCKGNKAILFPKIAPLDYLFISNYPIAESLSIIQMIPEVTIAFPMVKKHIGNRFEYFRKIFFN